MARLIWKENHKLAEQTVSLACEVALQPTHMLKRDGGFMTSCLYTVVIYYGWNTYPTTDRCYLKRFGGEGDHRDRFLKMFQLVQEFKVQFEQSFPLLSPGLANSRCFCGAGFMVLSPARGHCVRMMCALARTEHFHRTSVVVERGMKRKAGGGERKHFSGSNKWRCRV